MANISKGILYKKTIDDNGNITGKKPFFLKSLAKLIFTDEGTTVQKELTDIKTDITDIRTNNTHKVFENYEAYQAAVGAGTVTSKDICIINE